MFGTLNKIDEKFVHSVLKKTTGSAYLLIILKVLQEQITI
jgi:hypothetical protein